MLEGYFPTHAGSGTTIEQKQRLLAIQAALEIAKASAGATTSRSASDIISDDLKYAAQSIAVLADAIQAALAI